MTRIMDKPSPEITTLATSVLQKLDQSGCSDRDLISVSSELIKMLTERLRTRTRGGAESAHNSQNQ